MTTTRLPSWTRHLAPALAVLALLVVLYPGPLLRGDVFLSADAQNSDALRQVGDAGRQEGSYPLWNSYLFIGMPTFGSLAYTPGLYPPTLVLEFLHDSLGLPPLTWMLAHLFFGGLGMVWLLGRWPLPLAARLLGAVGWLFFAGTVAWGVHGHGSKLGAAMYLPWLAGLAWEVLTRGSLRAVALAGLLLGLQVLRGHVQITYYTLLLLGWLAAWNLAWPLDSSRWRGTAEPRPPLSLRARRAGLLGGAIVLGLLIGAVMLLPVHEYAAMSTRGQGDAGGGAGFQYATAWSLGVREVVTLVQPGAVGFGRATYLGAMPFNDYPNYFGWLWLLLAAAAWWTGRRSLVVGLGVAAVLTLLLALGNESPGLFQLFYAAMPYFDKFRVPSMILVMLALAAAILAAHGAAALADEAPGRDRARRGAVLVFGAVGALTFLTAAAGVGEDAFQENLAGLARAAGKQPAPVLLQEAWALHRGFLVREGLVLLAAAGAVFTAIRRVAFRRRGLVWVLAALLAVDLLSVAQLITHPERKLLQVTEGGQLAKAPALEHAPRADGQRQVDPALAEALRQVVGHDRVFPFDEHAQTNALMTAGIRSLGGYYPAKPAAAEQIRRRLYREMPAGRVASWLGATALTFPRELPAEAFDVLRQAGLDLDPAGVPRGGIWIYRNRAALPRARLADRWRPQNGAFEPLLDAIAAGTHDPRAAVVLDRDPQPAPQPGAAPLPAPEYVRDGLNEVVLRTRADRPAVLVLADLHAPGWAVEVDGQAQALLQADHVLRAVALTAGPHEVRFHYRDPAVSRGLALTLLGAAGVAAVGAAAWWRERKRPR